MYRGGVIVCFVRVRLGFYRETDCLLGQNGHKNGQNGHKNGQNGHKNGHVGFSDLEFDFWSLYVKYTVCQHASNINQRLKFN